MSQEYDENLRKLVLRMLDNDIKLRPYSVECYDELIKIEKIIEMSTRRNENGNMQMLLNNLVQRMPNVNNYGNPQVPNKLANNYDYIRANQNYIPVKNYFSHLNNQYLGYVSNNQLLDKIRKDILS